MIGWVTMTGGPSVIPVSNGTMGPLKCKMGTDPRSRAGSGVEPVANAGGIAEAQIIATRHKGAAIVSTEGKQRSRSGQQLERGWVLGDMAVERFWVAER